MKKLKICSVIIAACLLTTACNTNDGASSYTSADGNYEVTSSSVQKADLTTPLPATIAPETSVFETAAPDTTIPETTVPDTTVPETTTPETTTPKTTSPETTVPETTAVEKPKWNEESINDSLYVTVDCYERLSAYIGAPAGSLLKRGSKITVTATTDTDYYKMENGRYIHKDYTSKTKPSESVPTSSGSFETEINKITLKPVRTNNKTLDSLVDKILAKIITDDMTNSQKLKAAYDYIIANSTYGGGFYMYGDMTAFSGDNAYLSEYDMETVYFAHEILSSGVGVCDYYASAFTVLTRAIGFESYSTSGGVAYSGGGYTGHRWNNIKVGDTWYEFDAQIEDKYNELNGYTSYFFYGKARKSNPDLYIYPESENLYIEQYKGFKFADPLKGDITITVGTQKLNLKYEQKAANFDFWSSADSTEEYIEYENAKVPELTVTLNAKSGTAPYRFEIYVVRTDHGQYEYLFDESKQKTNEKSMSYKYQLPDFGEYIVGFAIKDSSAREIYKEATVCVTDISSLKGEITFKKETRAEYLPYGNVSATFTYTGGSGTVNTDTYAYATKNNEYLISNCIEHSQNKVENWYNFTAGEEYEVFVVATDSKGEEHIFSKKYTYSS